MKPYKSFLFIIFTLAVLLVFPLLFPNGEIFISDFKIRIYNLDYLKTQILQPLSETDSVQLQALSFQETAIYNPETEFVVLKSEKDTTATELVSIKTPEIKKEIKLIDSDLIIPPEWESKWSELGMSFSQTEIFDKPLRVLYYGDSQIENDRITSVFRKELQERYGGSGRGLVPVESIYNSANNFTMTSSSNWESKSVNKHSGGNLDLGLLCEAFRLKNDKPQDSVANSWIKIKALNKNIDNGYSVLSILYKASGKSDVKVNIDENTEITRELKTGSKIYEMRFNLEKNPEMVDLEFSTCDEVTMYGLNLESPNGIMVDNIALRGRSYPEFSKIDTTRLKQMAELLNPAVVVLQYGVNVVPNIRSDYSFYKNQLTRELSCLRSVLPEIPVVLIGVSDMAQKTNGYLHSYPNIENVLTAQKEAAIENGCAFWNLYESMGGKGSMIKWVETTPPLGNKDYVHYTFLGAEKVGHLFAQEFMEALDSRQVTASLKNEP
ncbi:MAG: hypothetical protein JXR31_14490 [Prolixibacteraceae bacterium]|nr:hypothetical protein [Prolixibacteraceae bacterium]MBN2775460.1 hypothetical protein [Prolixibacteraceae bacterium]